MQPENHVSRKESLKVTHFFPLNYHHVASSRNSVIDCILWLPGFGALGVDHHVSPFSPQVIKE